MTVGTRYKMIGGISITATQALWYRTSGGGAWTKMLLSQGELTPYPVILYPVGDDATYDMLLHLAEMIAVEGLGVINFGFTPSTGIVTLAKPGAFGSYFQISCYEDNDSSIETDNSAELWALLFPELARTGTYSITLSGAGDVTWTASEHHGFAIYPQRTVISDMTARNYKAVQGVADSGLVRTVWIGREIDYVYRVRMVGSHPRQVARGEYQALEDFLDWASLGYPVMIYPDRFGVNGGTPTQQFERLVNPYGWVRGVVSSADADWKPQAGGGNYYRIWEKELRLHAVGGPNA